MISLMLRDRQRRPHRWPRAAALAILLLPPPGAAAVPVAAQPSSSRQTVPSASDTGVIRGRILDEEGAPLAGAIVQARRAGAGAGPRQPDVAAETTTDDRGAFRLIGRPPESYLVIAAHPRPAAAGDNRQSALDRPTGVPPGRYVLRTRGETEGDGASSLP